jgi:hypothetical protein
MAGSYGSGVEIELRQMLAGDLDEKKRKLEDLIGVEEEAHWVGRLG